MTRELWGKVRVGLSNDRRIKLSEKDKANVRLLYEERGTNGKRIHSHNSLAKLYGVSKRLITFCIHPEKRAENYKKRVERGGSKLYYEKNSWRKTMKEHRAYKKRLFAEGKLCGVDK